MKKFNYIQAAKRIFEIEARVVLEVAEQLNETFDALCEDVLNMSGKLILMGVGKSGHISQKVAATLSSTGTPSFFIHPSEANHGDLGMITKNDCAILISNSGETSELFNLILHCKKLKIPIISITSNVKSTLAKKSDIVLQIPENVEACPLELAPTSSTTCMLVLGDALAVTLLKKRQFTSKDFLELHPGGKLGQMLLKVSDVMKTKNQIPLISINKKVDAAILEMSSKGQGCVGVVSEKKSELLGIITDGDLRRHMSPELLTKNVNDIMTKSPKTLKPETLVSSAIDLMNKQSITNYFITQKKKPIGIIHLHDILRN